MSCVKGPVDDFFFVRWIEPHVTDAEAIVDDVRRLHDERGRAVHYVAIIGPDVAPPSDDVRSSMRRNMDEMLRYCQTVHLVIEGKGFRRAMARSIGTGIFLLSKNRGRTFAHDSVEQALARVGVAPAAAGDLLRRAEAGGLLAPAAS